MNNMGFLALFIITLVISLGLFGFGIYKAVSLTKIPHNNIDFKKELKIIGISIIGFAVLFMLMSLAIYKWKGIPALPYEVAQGLLGGLFFPLSLGVMVVTFIIHYYRKNLPEKLDKGLYTSMMVSIFVTIIAFFVWTNGYADYFTYPIANGISFTEGLVIPKLNEGQHIAFYAFCILGGALFVYFLCDHRFYQQYGEHGILESTFFIAFPAGIIGARIGYVIGNWQKEFAGQPWWSIFKISDGGLTIIAGALVGIVVGVLWFVFRKKKYSIWVAVDVIVPTILLAQAIGRWGNFFNCEVHGFPVSEEAYLWLPKVIFNNIHYSSAHYAASGELIPLVGQVYTPLFLIECLTNIAGYVVLAIVFGKLLKKYTELGDLAFGYLIWYGLTRACMEPLRDKSFNMGTDGYWSWIWSMIFVVIGVALIAFNHIFRHIYRLKKEQISYKKEWITPGFIGLAITLLCTVTLMVVGLTLMNNNPITLTLAFTNYTNGLLIFIMGIACLIANSIPITYIVTGFKGKKI